MTAAICLYGAVILQFSVNRCIEHERAVFQRIYELSDLALNEREHARFKF